MVIRGRSRSEIHARQQVARDFAGAEQWREDLAAAGARAGEPCGDVRYCWPGWNRPAQTGSGPSPDSARVRCRHGCRRRALCHRVRPVCVAAAVPRRQCHPDLRRARFGAARADQQPPAVPLPVPGGVAPCRGRPGVRRLDRTLRGRLLTADGIGLSPTGGAGSGAGLRDSCRDDHLVPPPDRPQLGSAGRGACVAWPPRSDPYPRLGRDGRRDRSALAALGNAAALNPDWSWPDVTTDADAFTGTVRPPADPGNRRVANDVTVGPAGTVLIVTGSNMAGKSTLLRPSG